MFFKSLDHFIYSIVPNAPPQSIFSVNTSSTSLLVTWQPVPYSDANGVVYAYIVSIKRAQSNESWVNYTQYEPVLQMTYTGLLRYVVYTIKVSAVTSRGSGPFSTEVLPSTDQDSKYPCYIGLVPHSHFVAQVLS